MKHVAPLIFILQVMMFGTVCGQSGYLDRYPALKGDRVISRITPDGHYKITCFHTKYDIANLIVTNDTVTYRYPTSVYVANNPFDPNPVLNYGFLVRDIKIDGDTCWFCGMYWRETGEWIYNMQGNAYWEVEYTGFVGNMVLPQMVSGLCPVRYILVPHTECLNKMTLHPHGISAVGELGDCRSMFVDVSRNNNSQWNCSVGYSSFVEEEFRDITFAGGKIVVLSRFNRPQHVMYYKHGIGLRYSAPGTFLSTSLRVYTYSTRDVDGTSDLDFAPDSLIVFDKTSISEGVTVGYICNPTVPMNNYRGKFVQLVFPAENDHNLECILNTDSYRYRSIRDMSVLDMARAVVLLKDSLGSSILRFPRFQSGNENMLLLNGPEMMSVSTFPPSIYDMGMYVGGCYSDLQKKLTCLYETDLLFRLGSWSSENCSFKIVGNSTRIGYKGLEYPSVDSTMVTIIDDREKVHEMKFYASEVEPARECTDLK